VLRQNCCVAYRTESPYFLRCKLPSLFLCSSPRLLAIVCLLAISSIDKIPWIPTHTLTRILASPMYADMFDPLGAAGARRRAANARNIVAAPPPLVSFDTGLVDLTLRDDGSYDCQPNEHLRAQIRLLWSDGNLQWQVYNRRDNKVESTTPVTDDVGTFQRVPLSEKTHPQDRIYVWNKAPGQYQMYWMQDATFEDEDETILKVNQYLADPHSAKPASETATDSEGASHSNRLMGMDDTIAADESHLRRTNNDNNNNTSSSQVDALSTILENLGIPQSSQGTPSGADTTPAAAMNTGTTGSLTLADLQGAMASMQQQTGAATPTVGPPLDQVVTPQAMDRLMDNEAARDRLVALLPEGQQTPEALRENLRSPQIQQTLRALTQALLPDDEGNTDGFYSVLANFQLDPAHGQDALTQHNNPIQAFLDALLAKVEQDSNTESPDEEAKQD
jgi:hypothetical protein